MKHYSLKNRTAGFTLIELIVVIIIIGIMAGFAVLSIGLGHSDEVKQEARRLKALIELAAQESLLTDEDYGVVFSEKGYQFGTWAKEEEKYRCLAIGDDEHLTAPRELSDQFELELYLDDSLVDFSEEPPAGCHLLLLSDGEMVPDDFELIIRQVDSSLFYRLTGSITGQLTLEQQGEDDER